MPEGRLTKKTCEAGTVILQEGQPVPHACLILDGEVVVYKESDGRRIELATLGKGEIFGEMGILSAREASATVETTRETTLTFISPAGFKAFVDKSPRPMQAVIRHMVDRIYLANIKLGEVPVKEPKDCLTAQQPANAFPAMCRILQMLHPAPNQGEGHTKNPQEGVSVTTLFKTVKDILPLSRVEMERMLEQLAAVGAVKLTNLKDVRYGKDALGRSKKVMDKVVDRAVVISDPKNFLTVATNLDQEIRSSQSENATMEFLDLEDCAEQLETTKEKLYAKIGHQEIPENMFFMEKQALSRWAKVVGTEFFQRTKRKKLNLDELENVDDLVHVDNTTLKEAFQGLGFRKLSILLAAAGEEAREKMLGNMSQKIAKVVTDEADGMEVDEAELADLETQLFTAVRTIKTGK
jgi:CRP-like cAMP-binding protein